jgi:hypothetical protein
VDAISRIVPPQPLRDVCNKLQLRLHEMDQREIDHVSSEKSDRSDMESFPGVMGVNEGQVCMYVCMYVCGCVCMCVCVCMYAYIYMNIHTYIKIYSHDHAEKSDAHAHIVHTYTQTYTFTKTSNHHSREE